MGWMTLLQKCCYVDKISVVEQIHVLQYFLKDTKVEYSPTSVLPTTNLAIGYCAFSFSSSSRETGRIHVALSETKVTVKLS